MGHKKEPVSGQLLPLKVFQTRESPLTELLNNNVDIKSAYNMLLSLLIILVLCSICSYIVDPVLIEDDLQLFRWAFNKMGLFFCVWGLMVSSVSFPFLLISWPVKTPLLFVPYLLYMGLLFVLPMFAALYLGFSIVLKFALLIEQVRIIMKVHALVAENTWMLSDKDDHKPVRFSHVIYFLFAPTLVYRHNYPRTSHIDWALVLSYGIQYNVTLLTTFLTIPRFLRNNLQNSGSEPLDIKIFINTILVGALVGGKLMFLWWFGFLHCWLNMWAQLLRFGDRLFYDKWWQTADYSKYYRQWNIVVHDWLHNYIYREIVGVTGGNKSLGAMTTILTSAVFHEYIITLSLGFYFPVMFVLFAGIGAVVYFVSVNMKTHSDTIGNVFLFFSIFFGWSLLLNMYGAEWYSRINCPPKYGFLADKVIPRFWGCVTFKL